jgi:hypothetical protein
MFHHCVFTPLKEKYHQMGIPSTFFHKLLLIFNALQYTSIFFIWIFLNSELELMYNCNIDGHNSGILTVPPVCRGCRNRER